MGKKIISICVLCVLFMLPVMAQDQKGEENQGRRNGVITRTYELRYVSARSINSIVAPYILQMGRSEGSPYIVITMQEQNRKAFEDLLAKLDQPKKTIRFRIFTLLASQRQANEAGEIPDDLSGVVREISQVLGYKHYLLDGVSTLSAADGSERNELILNSRIDDLVLTLRDIAVSGDEDGKGSRIAVGLMLREKFGGIIVEKDRQVIDRVLLSADRLQIKEGGYLVAGVSRIDSAGAKSRGAMGDALVLVINAVVE